jgi:hypothetical protein
MPAKIKYRGSHHHPPLSCNKHAGPLKKQPPILICGFGIELKDRFCFIDPEQPAGQGYHNGAGPVASAQFVDDAPNMLLGRSFSNEEQLCNLYIGVTSSHEHQGLSLAFGEFGLSFWHKKRTARFYGLPR